MKKTIKPVIDEEKLGVNTFTINLKIPVNKITMSGQYSHQDGLLLPVEIFLEKESATRVYVDADRRKQMVGLTPRGKDLLLWLIYEVDNGKDWVWVNYRRWMDECKVKTYNTYKAAIDDLIANGFISRTVVQQVFWINPYFFFNGSRINKFPKNVVKR